MSDATIATEWRTYRTGKMFGSLGEVLERMIFEKPQEKVAKMVSFAPVGEAIRKEPRAGSPFWMWHITPPDWFREEVEEGDIAKMFEMARTPEPVEKKRRRRRRRRKQ